MAERSDTTEAPIWLPLPLIGMALLGMRAVRQAQAVGRAALELDDSGEALLFLAEADTVLLHSTLTERTARVPFAVLHEAWERFATDAVREFARWYPHEAARYESGLAKALTDDPTTFGTSAWRFFDEENRHGFDHVDAVEP